MSNVKRNGKWERPGWAYNGKITEHGIGFQQLEMLESTRNVLEQIRDSQMLQCAVAQNITAMLREIRGLRRDLKKFRERAV